MASLRSPVTVIGAGLAGCELSVQLADAGVPVILCEQKPDHRTPAQVSSQFGELVCSNSLRSSNPSNAVGLLKEEMGRLNSVVIRAAHAARVPAGDALAVDRERFSAILHAAVHDHPNIRVRPGRVDAIPDAREGTVVLATGPMTADALAASLAERTGQSSLYFYDAIAPIVAGDSIDRSVAFAASRWDKGEGADYLNCPLNEAEYESLLDLLLSADAYPAHAFEEAKYFPGCQPIEVIAQSGREALRFGPLKPVGLTDPRTGAWPHAVVQLRREDAAGQAFNLVGLQTKLRHGAQKELMRRIPGLAGADILRFGALHRNTFVDAPTLLDDTLALRAAPHVHLAGQITGVEGYVESAACGLLLARLLDQRHHGAHCPPPPLTALGALYAHVRGSCRLPGRPHEPQNVHWGLFAPAPTEPTEGRRRRRSKADYKAERVAAARAAFDAWLPQANGTPADIAPMPASREEACSRASA